MSISPKKYRCRFLNNCVGTSGANLARLHAMIEDAHDVTRDTFLRNVDGGDMREIEIVLGYERYWKRGLTMAADWHVSYHRSHWGDVSCYFFKWSAIEYYFV